MAGSTTLRVLYAALSNASDRPPLLPRWARPVISLALLADRGLDAASTHRGADRHRGIGLVRQDPARPGPSAIPTRTLDPQVGHHRFEGDRVVTLTRGDHPRYRPASGVRGHVHLRRISASGATQRLPIRLPCFSFRAWQLLDPRISCHSIHPPVRTTGANTASSTSPGGT
jgi:hypothetical protein